MEQLNPVFQEAISALYMALAATLIYFVRVGIVSLKGYLEGKLGKTNFDLVASWAETSVRFLEQSPVYKDFDGAKKFEIAKIDLLKFIAEKHIPMSSEQLDKLIEATVHMVKQVDTEVVLGTLVEE